MKSLTDRRRSRLAEIDNLLRSEGVVIRTIAAKWNVKAERIKDDLSYLKFHVGEIIASQEPITRVYWYRYR